MMGDMADDILCSFGLNSEEAKKYDMVMEKFESHFVKIRKIIFKRATFNQRCQREGDSVDNFITSLYCLSEHYGYGNLRDEMIRDRIVVGILNPWLSEQLQLDPGKNLPWEKVETNLFEWKNSSYLLVVDIFLTFY